MIDNILLGDICVLLSYKKIGVRIAQRRKRGQNETEYFSRKNKPLRTITTLTNIENGYSVPSIETFAKICNVLNITPDYLLLGTLKSNNISQNIVE